MMRPMPLTLPSALAILASFGLLIFQLHSNPRKMPPTTMPRLTKMGVKSMLLRRSPCWPYEEKTCRPHQKLEWLRGEILHYWNDKKPCNEETLDQRNIGQIPKQSYQLRGEADK